MAGLIWFVQLVHYPLFADVGAAAFAGYERVHARNTTWVVAPPMIIELGSASGIAVFVGGALPAAGLVFLAVIWGSTWALQVPAHARLERGFDAATLSRDGRRLLSVAQDGTASRLWVRSLDRLEGVGLQSAGESVVAVMVSPDGAWAAYADAASGTLKKVRIDSDASVAITPPASAVVAGFRGGTWGTSGTIVFATSTNPGLMQVSDAGGTPVALTAPDAGYHSHPHFLPDGQTLLYTVNRPGAAPRIAVRSLDGTTERESLMASGLAVRPLATCSSCVGA